MTIKNQKKDTNALLLAIFFYQYGLFAIPAVFIGGQQLIMLNTILLLAYLMLKNSINLNTKTILLFLLPLCLLLVKLPFEYYIFGYNDIATKMLKSYLTVGLAGLLIGSIGFSFKKFLQYGYALAWINFLLLCLIPISSLYGEKINYMKFGYTMLPTLIFSFYFIFDRNKRFWALILFVVSTAELAVFGARGAMLTFILFALSFIYFTPILKLKTKLYFTFFSALMISNLAFILQTVFDVLEENGFSSYALTKYINIVNGNSLQSTSSGRDVAYQKAIERIEESLFLGSPINSSLKDTGLEYYHNIFFDIIISFGALGMFAFLIFIGYFIFLAIKSNDHHKKVVFLILFMVPIGRLTVSSSLWQRPEFWLFLSFCLNSFVYQKKTLNKKYFKQIFQ